jgi:general secretion pathway protein H
MSRHGDREGDLEAGFTLIEMLLVLTILALTTTMIVPLVSGGSEGARLQMAASDLASAFRLTRSAAITRNRDMSLMIDVNKRTFNSAVVSQRAFAPDIDAKLTFAAGLGSGTTDGGFRFFPDGSSTGGDVTLSLRGKQTRLCVDWLTGVVGQDQAC